MKAIKDLNVKQIKIFPKDYIPYAYLLRPDFIKHFCKKYKFQKHEIPFEHYQERSPNLLFFFNGEYTINGQKIIIQQLSFEERKIVLNVKADSKTSTKVFDAIARDVKKVDPSKEFKRSDALLQSEESSCIAKLEINYTKVFSNELNDFISNQFVPLLSHEMLEIKPIRLSFEVHFKQEEKLQKTRISLSPKRLTVEPRSGHPMEEKVFYTESPFNSDTHLALLKKFEKVFSV